MFLLPNISFEVLTAHFGCLPDFNLTKTHTRLRSCNPASERSLHCTLPDTMNRAAIARGWAELTDGFEFDSTFWSLMALLLVLFVFAVCVDPGVRTAVERIVAVFRAVFTVLVLLPLGRLLRSVLSGLAFGFFGFLFAVAVIVRILLLELADCLAALRSLDLLNSAKLAAALADLEALRLEKVELKTEVTNLSERAREPPADRHVITRRPLLLPSAPRSSAPVHPGIFQPTRLERRRQATQTLASSTYTTTQNQTAQVDAKRPKYVDGVVQTNFQQPVHTRTAVSSFSGVSSLSGILGIQSVSPSPAVQTVNVSSLSFSSIKAVHTIEPMPDPRPAFSFSSITAVHTVEPVSAPRPARSETRDAGVQVHSTEELASRDTLTAQAERHAADIVALEERRASDLDFLKTQHAAALARAKADHDAEIAALRTSHANEFTSLRSSATDEIASRNSGAATLRAELDQYKQAHAGIKTTMHEASARYDTMSSRVSSQTSEIETLRIQLSAAQAAASSSADPAAIEQKMAQMQAEYNRTLEMKDRDIERVRAAGTERQNRLAADLKKAEAKAKEPEMARARVAALEHQLKFGAGAGVGASVGANKNSIALKEELEATKKQRDDWAFHSNANAEKLVACDGARRAAVARVGELERECARLRGSLGPGARTIVAAPSVSAVAGRKRVASEEMSGGEGKRMRD
jgi:hypothetical protein